MPKYTLILQCFVEDYFSGVDASDVIENACGLASEQIYEMSVKTWMEMLEGKPSRLRDGSVIKVEKENEDA